MKKVFILYVHVPTFFSTQTLRQLSSNLPAFFLEKAREYVHKKDHYTYILGRLLLKKHLTRFLEHRNAQLKKKIESASFSAFQVQTTSPEQASA